MYCKLIIGSSQLITYFPNYKEIFDDHNPNEQNFMANIMIANLKTKKDIENESKSILFPCAPIYNVLFLINFFK